MGTADLCPLGHFVIREVSVRHTFGESEQLPHGDTKCPTRCQTSNFPLKHSVAIQQIGISNVFLLPLPTPQCGFLSMRVELGVVRFGEVVLAYTKGLFLQDVQLTMTDSDQ